MPKIASEMHGELTHLLRDARACVERLAPDGKVLFAAGAVEALRGVAAPLRAGQGFWTAVSRGDVDEVKAALRRALDSDARVSVRYYARRGGGRGRMVTTDFRREPGGTVIATTRRWSPAEGHAAFVDAVQEAIDRGDPRYAVVLVELIELHKVAGVFGYRRAEDVFEQVASELEDLLPPGVRLWPVGRNQLGILLEGGSPERTDGVVRDIEHFFSKPMNLAEESIRVRARVGVSTARPRYVSSEQLLVDAEAAAHRGTPNVSAESRIFSTSFMEEDRRQLSLAGALGSAIQREELRVVFQPIIDLLGAKVSGFEVLVRWKHPQLGHVSPAEFIPLAEELDIVASLDAWVLERACKQLVEWGVSGCMLSANISAHYADDLQLVDRVRATLGRTGFSASELRLEVTETAIVQNAERCREVLSGLHGSGISVAMDDFGTGYASFRQLADMPLDVLKVDRSFVERIEKDARGRQIVHAVVTMAHQLGMKVVAEGVETREQLACLQEMGCDYAQGYLFAKPLEVDEAREWVGRPVEL